MYSAIAMRKAIIDIGSNSVLLLVAERIGEGWSTVVERSRVTGLGKGLTKGDRLDPDARNRTLAAIADFANESRKLGCQQVIAAGTMAVRMAADGEQFLSEVASLGIEARMISGEEEAILSLKSAALDPLFRSSQPTTCIDPGGHSTEIAVGSFVEDQFHVLHFFSAKIGALSILKDVFTPEAVDFRQRLEATEQIDEAIGQRFLPNAAGKVVTVGATGTNLVSIRDELETWNPEAVHGAELGYEEVSMFVDRLCGMSLEERSSLIGIEPGRAATMHAGALILERCLFAVGAESCSVSVKGWRHALLD